MKKNIIILIVIVAVVGLVWWAVSSKDTAMPTGTNATADTTDSIQKDLQGLDTGNIDQEFQAIDKDVNQL